MPTSSRVAAVLTGLTLALGTPALLAPAAHADIPACTRMAGQTDADAGTITSACHRGVNGDLQGCVNGLTEAGVPGGAANGACRLAAHEPR
ncbi:hypothetical protein ACFVTC_15515 [Streptomyces sp. NPDC057950]|uniref:hypothetical protein n=1 Tax=Streptomyces sp. NPDC057950 TaxID=3346288 RepID=UPI0036F183C0